MESHKIYDKGGEWRLLLKVTDYVKLVFEVVSIKFVAPLAFNLH